MQHSCNVILHALVKNRDMGYCGKLARVRESGLGARAGEKRGSIGPDKQRWTLQYLQYTKTSPYFHECTQNDVTTLLRSWTSFYTNNICILLFMIIIQVSKCFDIWCFLIMKPDEENVAIKWKFFFFFFFFFYLPTFHPPTTLGLAWVKVWPFKSWLRVTNCCTSLCFFVFWQFGISSTTLP